MARQHVLAAVTAVLAASLGASGVEAQFGGIFDPPRPPGDVGRTPPPQAYPPPSQAYPPPQPQAYPPPQGQGYPQQQAYPAPGAPAINDVQRRAPVQSQPLPPPPGAVAAPPPPPPASQQSALPRPGQPGQPAPPAGPPGQRPPAPDVPVQPGDEIITELPSQKVPNPTAIFSGLDKITGRITNFDVYINETVQFGALQVTPRVCYTRPPNETPNTDAFLDVSEITLQGETRPIFTGWMFASSPGLHAIEHPIYDVWLKDCKGGDATAVAARPSPPATPDRPPPPLRR